MESLLLEMGCDLAHREKKGWTCLHLAARNGQPEKARFLLESGADVHETQNQGTALNFMGIPPHIIVCVRCMRRSYTCTDCS